MERRERNFFELELKNDLINKLIDKKRRELREREKERKENNPDYVIKKRRITKKMKEQITASVETTVGTDAFNSIVDKRFSSYTDEVRMNAEAEKAHVDTIAEDKARKTNPELFSTKGSLLREVYEKFLVEKADEYFLNNKPEGFDDIKVETDKYFAENTLREKAYKFAADYSISEEGKKELTALAEGFLARKELIKIRKQLIEERETFAEVVLEDLQNEYTPEQVDNFNNILDELLNGSDETAIKELVGDGLVAMAGGFINIYNENEIDFPEVLPVENQLLDLVNSGKNPYKNNFQLIKDVQEFFVAVEYDVISNEKKYPKKVRKQLFNENTANIAYALTVSLPEGYGKTLLNNNIMQLEDDMYFVDYVQAKVNVSPTILEIMGGAKDVTASVLKGGYKILKEMFIKPKKPSKLGEKYAELQQTEKFKESYAKWDAYHKYRFSKLDNIETTATTRAEDPESRRAIFGEIAGVIDGIVPTKKPEEPKPEPKPETPTNPDDTFGLDARLLVIKEEMIRLNVTEKEIKKNLKEIKVNVTKECEERQASGKTATKAYVTSIFNSAVTSINILKDIKISSNGKGGYKRKAPSRGKRGREEGTRKNEFGQFVKVDGDNNNTNVINGNNNTQIIENNTILRTQEKEVLEENEIKAHQKAQVEDILRTVSESQNIEGAQISGKLVDKLADYIYNGVSLTEGVAKMLAADGFIMSKKEVRELKKLIKQEKEKGYVPESFIEPIIEEIKEEIETIEEHTNTKSTEASNQTVEITGEENQTNVITGEGNHQKIVINKTVEEEAEVKDPKVLEQRDAVKQVLSDVIKSEMQEGEEVNLEGKVVNKLSDYIYGGVKLTRNEVNALKIDGIDLSKKELKALRKLIKQQNQQSQ